MGLIKMSEEFILFIFSHTPPPLSLSLCVSLSLPPVPFLLNFLVSVYMFLQTSKSFRKTNQALDPLQAALDAPKARRGAASPAPSTRSTPSGSASGTPRAKKSKTTARSPSPGRVLSVVGGNSAKRHALRSNAHAPDNIDEFSSSEGEGSEDEMAAAVTTGKGKQRLKKSITTARAKATVVSCAVCSPDVASPRLLSPYYTCHPKFTLH